MSTSVSFRAFCATQIQTLQRFPLEFIMCKIKIFSCLTDLAKKNTISLSNKIDVSIANKKSAVSYLETAGFFFFLLVRESLVVDANKKQIRQF